MQCESRERAIGALKWMEIAQDPRMWSVPGRRLRVGITSIIQHAGLLDAIERNRTEHNNIEQSKTQQSSTILYYTVLYCTVLYCTVLLYYVM